MTLFNKWLFAIKRILPLYITIHIAFMLLTLFSVLFRLNDFGIQSLPLYTLWQAWDRWDTGQYTAIAQHGYDGSWRTAFFPLFPFLEKLGHNPFITGLIIANIAYLGVTTVLYQLVKEDFEEETASRAVLYLIIFPSAFFLIAAYTESLFLFLALLSFYHIRHQNFWLAGLFGLLAGLTRSTGIFLLLPFAYELWRRRQFKFDILSIGLVPMGIALFSAYCYYRFHDALAWDHAQSVWHHQLMAPWGTIYLTIHAIRHNGLLSFTALHNALDLIPIGFVLIMLISIWRLPYKNYAIYSIPMVLFFLSVPIIGTPLLPFQSFPRFMLEAFPVFILAGDLGKHRWFHESYVLISATLCLLSCLLFLTGHWMV